VNIKVSLNGRFIKYVESLGDCILGAPSFVSSRNYVRFEDLILNGLWTGYFSRGSRVNTQLFSNCLPWVRKF
jgi:hypothetical protein